MQDVPSSQPLSWSFGFLSESFFLGVEFCLWNSSAKPRCLRRCQLHPPLVRKNGHAPLAARGKLRHHKLALEVHVLN